MRRRWKIPKNMTPEQAEDRKRKIGEALRFHQKRLNELQADILESDKYSSDYKQLKDLYCYQHGMVEILKMGYLYPGELPDDLYRKYFPYVNEEPVVLPDYVCFDLETTDKNPKTCNIIEIGAVKVRNGKIIDTFDSLVRCPVTIYRHIVSLTGITIDENIKAPILSEVLPKFVEFIGKDTLVGHNIKNFDFLILDRCCSEIGIKITNNLFDTLEIARDFLPLLPSHKLSALCDFYGTENLSAHRALSDAEANHYVFQNLIYGEIGDPLRISEESKDTNESEFPDVGKNIKDLCKILYQVLYNGISGETINSVFDWFEKHPVLKKRHPYSEIFQKIQIEEYSYNNDYLFNLFLNFIKENYYSFGGTALCLNN